MKTNTPPPCAGKHELFDSREKEDHLEAKKLCDTCPVFAACWDNLQAVRNAPAQFGGSPEGTWAGQRFGSSRWTASLKPCGSETAYKRHKRHGEDPCDPCKRAHADGEKARAARRRGEAA